VYLIAAYPKRLVVLKQATRSTTSDEVQLIVSIVAREGALPAVPLVDLRLSLLEEVRSHEAGPIAFEEGEDPIMAGHVAVRREDQTESLPSSDPPRLAEGIPHPGV
jgi:hypothetical protein